MSSDRKTVVARAAVPVLESLEARALFAAVGPSSGFVAPAMPVTATNTKQIVKVLVLNYDPFVPSQGNVRLHTALGYNDPHTLAAGYEAEMEKASGGAIDLEVVGWRDLNYIPKFKDGFQYTPDNYYALRSSPTSTADDFHTQSSVDVNAVIADQGIAALVNSGQVDEIWTMDDHYYLVGGEAFMAGPRSFFVNGDVIPDSTLTRPVAGYGFSFERGVAEMVHDTGHRTENHLRRSYNEQWDSTNPTTAWEKFATYAATNANGTGGVGNVHFPTNAVQDYDYGNARTVQSTAADWLNYPNLTGAIQPVNDSAWSAGTDPDYQKDYLGWWFGHLPRASGTTADGRQNDWWKYVYDYDDYDDATGLPKAQRASAALGAPATGAATYSFTVAYADPVDVDVATLGNDDVLVTGPNGFSQPATLVAKSDARNGHYRVATYQITAPGGTWDAADAGAYTVTQSANGVKDAAGRAIPAASLGTFTAPGGTTGAATVLQAETATLAGGTVKSVKQGGYLGTGYADYAGLGSSVTFAYTAAASGTGKLDFRYSNGGSAGLPLQIQINGSVVGTISGAPTGGWNKWATATLTGVTLPAGAVAIKAVVATGTDGVDLDQLTVTPDPVTPPPAANHLEAETATLTGGTLPAHKETGYTGSGYADFGGNGSAAQFAFASTAGTATLKIRYANGGTTNRPLTVLVNGVSAGSFACPPTGGWGKWLTATLDVTLNAGNNTVKLVAGSATGGNVDWLEVSPSTPPVVTTLATPTNLHLSENNPTQTRLLWDEPASAGLSGFTVQISTDNTNWTTVDANFPADRRDDVIPGLSPNTTYFYRVRANATASGYANSAFSAALQQTTPPLPIVPALVKPTNLHLSENNPTQVRLLWDEPASDGLAGFTVQISTDNANWTTVDANFPADRRDDVIPGLSPNTAYFVRVRANASGDFTNSDFSDALAFTTPAIPTLATPSNLHLSENNPTQTRLLWDEPASAGLADFTVQISTDNTNWTTLDAHFPADRRDDSIPNLSPSTTYFYRVRANATGDFQSSDFSAALAATTPGIPVLATPTNLHLSENNYTSARLLWDEPADAKLAGFRVQVSTDNANWTTVDANFPADRRDDAIGGLKPSTTYYYRVQALAAAGAQNSAFSGVLAQTTPDVPAPVNLRNQGTPTRTSIGLQWGYSGSLSPVRFEIRQRITGSGNGFGGGENTPGTARSAVRDTNLSPNTSYDFRIRAVFVIDGVEYASAWVLSAPIKTKA